MQAAAGGGATGFMMSALEGVVSMGGGSATKSLKKFGRIQNPYVEQVFNGVNMRTLHSTGNLFQGTTKPKNSSNHQKTQSNVFTRLCRNTWY